MRRIGRRAGFIAGMLIGVARRGCSRRCGDGLGELSRCSAPARSWSASPRPSCSSSASPPPTRRAPAFRPRAISLVMAGGIAAAIIGPQTVIHIGRSLRADPLRRRLSRRRPCSALAGGARPRSSSTFRASPRHGGQPSGRPLGEIARQPEFLIAVGCATSAFALMSFVMTAAPLAMVLHHHHRDDGRARHPVACARHVRAELRHRLADRPLRRGADRRDRPAAPDRLRAGGARRHQRRAFLAGADPARARLEFRLHRRHHAGDRDLSAGGEGEGPGAERFPDLRHGRARLLLVRRDAARRRLGRRSTSSCCRSPSPASRRCSGRCAGGRSAA